MKCVCGEKARHVATEVNEGRLYYCRSCRHTINSKRHVMEQHPLLPKCIANRSLNR
jgi:hypothetical protein